LQYDGRPQEFFRGEKYFRGKFEIERTGDSGRCKTENKNRTGKSVNALITFVPPWILGMFD